MITRFRKGQQIRQNDLNSIINGLTGRMIGGVGINARKLGGNIVLDAQPRVYRQELLLEYGDIIMLDKNLNPINARYYGLMPNTNYINKININIRGNDIIIYSDDGFLRILNKTNLTEKNKKEIQDTIDIGESTSSTLLYKNSTTGESNIYLNYSKIINGNSRLMVGKYDSSLNLLDEKVLYNDTPSPDEGVQILGINNTTDYLISRRFSHNKFLNSINYIDEPSEIPQDTAFIRANADVFCDDSLSFVAYSMYYFRGIFSINSSGVLQNKFVHDSTESLAGYGAAVCVDGDNVYFCVSARNEYSYVYKMTKSLSVISSLEISQYYDGTPAIGSICVIGDYIYGACIRPLSPINQDNLLIKIDKTTLEPVKSWNYEGRKASEGLVTSSMNGLGTDGNNIYIIGRTKEA